jgi:DNA-binding phage protein
MKAISYRQGLLRRLSSKRYASKLLQHAFEESCKDGNWEAFGLVLQDVIEAHGNKQAFARKIRISRQHLYRICGKNANPTLKTLLPLLSSLGLRLALDLERKEAA